MNKIIFEKKKRLKKIETVIKNLNGELLKEEKNRLINLLIVEEGISKKLAREEVEAVLMITEKGGFKDEQETTKRD